MLTLLLLSFFAIFTPALVRSADAQGSSDYPLIGCLKIGFSPSPHKTTHETFGSEHDDA
jgi:hypothetical protein